MSREKFLGLSKMIILMSLVSIPVKVFGLEGDESRLRRNSLSGNTLQGNTLQGNISQGNISQEGSARVKDEEIRRTLGLVRNLKLVKELSLPEDKANMVLEKLRRMDQLQSNFSQQRRGVVSQLEKIVNSSNPEQLELKAKLRELREIETNYVSEKERTKKEIYDLLTPQQRARYILFQQKFQNELRQVITDIRRNYQTNNTTESGTSVQRLREGTILQNRRR